MLSSLIKESPYVKEVDKAEAGLINYFNQPGPGLEPKDQEGFTMLLKNYVDKKIALNQKRSKDHLIDILRKNLFDIADRVKALSEADKMQRSANHQELSKHENNFKRNVENSSLDTHTKSELKEEARKIKEWKLFDFYRKALELANKETDSLKDELKKELSDLIQDTRDAEKPSQLKEAAQKLKDLTGESTKEEKDAAKAIEDALEAKSQMMLAQKNAD